MAKACDVCGKGYIKGSLVPRGIGDRVTRRTNRRQEANLRSKRFETTNGQKFWLRICTSCLKRLRFDEQKAQEVAAEPINA